MSITRLPILQSRKYESRGVKMTCPDARGKETMRRCDNLVIEYLGLVSGLALSALLTH